MKKELDAEGLPYADDVQVGIMIETPAAAVISDRLAREVDFFSCGTNDLTQYTLACDRQNNDLGRFFNPHHPAVLRLLKMVCDNAHRNGVWVGICGELGADLELTETFLSIGIDELSVSPRSVLPLRQKIRETTIGNVKEKILAFVDKNEKTLVDEKVERKKAIGRGYEAMKGAIDRAASRLRLQREMRVKS